MGPLDNDLGSIAVIVAVLRQSLEAGGGVKTERTNPRRSHHSALARVHLLLQIDSVVWCALSHYSDGHVILLRRQRSDVRIAWVRMAREGHEVSGSKPHHKLTKNSPALAQSLRRSRQFLVCAARRFLMKFLPGISPGEHVRCSLLRDLSLVAEHSARARGRSTAGIGFEPAIFRS
jgi:hypothetical protein